MKNKILLFLSLCFIQFIYAHAAKDTLANIHYHLNYKSAVMAKCDACGSASGGSMGFSSMLNNNFVGIRYFNQTYSSRDGIFANSPRITENFHTIQVWSKISVTKKIQLSVLIPYHFHNRQLAAGNEHIQGLGDISVLAFYDLFQIKKDSSNYAHKLQIGGGIKVPTGEYETANNLGSVNPSFQIGTGSWDYILATEYVINRKKLGLSTVLNYTFKTENQKEYQFGNQLNYGSTLFYLFDLKQVRLMPQAGFSGEVYEGNEQYGQAVLNTNGDVFFGKLGFEAGKDKWSIGVNALFPIHQNLTGGNVDAKYRWSVNLNYTL